MCAIINRSALEKRSAEIKPIHVMTNVSPTTILIIKLDDFPMALKMPNSLLRSLIVMLIRLAIPSNPIKNATALMTLEEVSMILNWL